jgi:hypothetical protein
MLAQALRHQHKNKTQPDPSASIIEIVVTLNSENEPSFLMIEEYQDDPRKKDSY